MLFGINFLAKQEKKMIDVDRINFLAKKLLCKPGQPLKLFNLSTDILTF